MNETTIEVVTEIPQDLALVVQSSGLEAASARNVTDVFAPLFAQAHDWAAKVATIHVTDATQVREMKLARESRLALKEIRVIAEKNRTRLKEDSLRRGRAIDSVYNTLEALVKPLEAQLKEQEEFVKRQEEQRRARIKAEREEALRPFGVNTAFYQLADMPESDWAELFNSTVAAHRAKEEAAQRAEAERLAKEQAEAAERERIRQENERLRQEAEEREAAAKAERERLAAEKKAIEAAAKAELAKQKAEADRLAAIAAAKALAEKQAADAKAKVEREAREKAEAEARRLREDQEALKQAEALKFKQEAEAKAKAARAPDREKIAALGVAVLAIKMPEVSTPEGQAALAVVKEQFTRFAKWITDKSATL